MTRAHILTTSILLLVLSAFLAEPAAGQRRPTKTTKKPSATTDRTTRTTRAKNPLEQARAMRKARRSAGETARTLEKQWRQPPREAAKTLRDAGYPTREIVAAFDGHARVSRAEMSGLLVQIGLTPKDAISVANAKSFRDPVFGTVDLDCVGPNGFPVPCGIQGGAGGTPAMGALSWSPKGEGIVDEILTIESTNIPEVAVEIGGTPLTLLEASSQRVRARLPSQPTTGQLVLVRQSDGQVGVVESTYQVLEPTPPTNWPQWGAVATDAAIEEANAWLDLSKIDESRCRVDGPLATGKPGVLTSDYAFEGRIRKDLQDVGAPPKVAQGWQRAFEDAWNEWAQNAMIPALPWYPAFAAFPGEEAPPMPNVPTPLGSLVSTGVAEMSPPMLQARVGQEIGNESDGSGRDAAIQQFANSIGARFASYLVKAQVMLVMGHGPVPSYTTPDEGHPVPAGPVVGGTCYTDENSSPLLNEF